MPNPADPKAIDISPETVAKRARDTVEWLANRALGFSLWEWESHSHNLLDCANQVDALSAALSEAPQKASLFGSDVLLGNSKQVTVGHPTRFDKDKFTMLSGKYTPPTHFRPLPSPPKDPAHE